MKTKILLLSVVSILILGLAAGAYWWMSRPQVITFSDDARVTLLAVQYGKRHAAPTVKTSTKSGARAPARRGGSFTTTNDTLVLWVRQQYDASGNQYHSFQYYVYDKAGTACVQTYSRNYGGGNQRGNDIVAVQFDAFPRRQGKFIVRVQEQGNGGQEMSDQKFVVSNPVRKSFPAWTAEPLPTTREDGDLSVSLTKLVSGADIAINRNQDNPDDAANKGVQAVFHIARNGKPVTNWEPVSVETSDATGNRVNVIRVGQNGWQNGWGNNAWANDEGRFVYQYALWPDEPAWKIKLEFSQQSDFAANELWSVPNIPVQPGRQQDFYNYARNGRTNAAVAETDLNGVHFRIFPAKQFTDLPANAQPQGGLTIQADQALPEGMRMTLVKLTDDQNNDVGYWDNGSGRNNNVTFYRYSLRDIAGVTNLNLTISLHKSRFVEFTAKPEKAAAAQ
jgi:hypothetical protein